MNLPLHIRYDIAFLAGLLLSCTATLAQSRVDGTVREGGSGEPVPGVNVMVRLSSGAIIGYDITDKEGSYSIEYSSEADTLTVNVAGFNINPQSRQIAAGTSRADFTVEYARQKIREVKVTASPISRQSDTVTYYVENFRDSTDRTIGEVLQKLPGIEMTPTGSIKYQGKEISRFYIEGLDMLGGRYSIATENIQAKDIAAVEVYENHQPIKVLQDWVKSDRAAINLRLKSGAKGTWNAVLGAGAGYSPWLWSGEAVPMYFGKDFQTISTYKTNNTGDDVSRELTSHFGGIDGSHNLLHVTDPQTPPVSESRYLDNGIHAVSVNTINRLGKDTDLTADASYIHDDLDSEGSSVTTYYLPGSEPMSISETIASGHRTDRIGVNLQLRTNNRKTYLTERLSFEGEKVSDAGSVSESGQDVSQTVDRPRATLRNRFYLVKRVNGWQLSFNSDTDWNTQSSTLTVSPTPYPEIFGAQSGTGSTDAVQTLRSSRVRTDNSFYTSYMKGRWSFFLNAGIKFHHETMNSALSANTAGTGILPAADTMRNDMVWHRLDIIAGPSVTYNIRNVFNASLSLPLDLMDTGSSDRVTGNDIGGTSLLFSPRLSVMTQITYNLKLNAYASWSESAGDLYDSYSGYVMTGYRTVGKKNGIPQRTSRQSASADLSYADALNALFISASASWWRSRTNMTMGTDYRGALSISTAEENPNVTQGVSSEARVSKRVDFLSTTVSVSGGWGRTWYEFLRQGVLMPTVSDHASAGLRIDSRLGGRVTFGYRGDYTRSMSRIDGRGLAPIDRVTQSADIGTVLPKGFILKIGGEHYFNASVEGRDRHMFFLDASLSFRKGRLEYIIEGRNLLDSRTFSSEMYSDITSYIYTTSLRPVSVMFKIRFSLR